MNEHERDFLDSLVDDAKRAIDRGDRRSATALRNILSDASIGVFAEEELGRWNDYLAYVNRLGNYLLE